MGGINRPHSAALNRARDVQLKKRSERMVMQGMVVANHHDGHMPLSDLALTAPPAPPAAASAPRSDAKASTLGSQPVVPSLPPRPAATSASASEPASDDLTARGDRWHEMAVQPMAARPISAVSRSVSADSVGTEAAHFGSQPAEADSPVNSGSARRLESGGSSGAVTVSRAQGEPSEHPVPSASASVPVPARPVTAAPAGGQLSRQPQAPVALDLSDIKSFLSRPAPTGPLIQCHIQRSKMGFMQSYAKYTLVLRQPGQPERVLMAARKRGQSKSSNYLISLDSDDLTRDSGSYFGKLRSNFIGTEFVLYDAGLSPDKADKGLDEAHVRQELCAVLYKQNVLYTRGPRKMTVVAPAIVDGVRKVLRPSRMNDESSIVEKHRANEKDPELVTLKNKSPKWNDVANAYVLNFNGRVTQPSVKNFQIVDEKDSEEVVIMQFGRVGDNDFTCDFQYPLSPLQAFGIALSSFDYKIACE